MGAFPVPTILKAMTLQVREQQVGRETEAPLFRHLMRAGEVLLLLAGSFGAPAPLPSPALPRGRRTLCKAFPKTEKLLFSPSPIPAWLSLAGPWPDLAGNWLLLSSRHEAGDQAGKGEPWISAQRLLWQWVLESDSPGIEPEPHH